MANADVFAAMSKKGGLTSEDIYGPVSTAPSQMVMGAVQPGAGGPGGSTTTTGAMQAEPAAPAEIGRFAGSGNYEYAKMSDGTIKITKSTRGGEGTIVMQDSPFYDLIVSDIEKYAARGTKAPAAKPAAAKAPAAKPAAKAAAPAPAKAAPKAAEMNMGESYEAPAAPDMGESEQEMGEATSTEDVRMGETEMEDRMGFSEDVADAMLDMTSEAGAPAMSKGAKDAELAKFMGSAQGVFRRNQLRDAAAAGLMRGPAKLSRAQAQTAASELAKKVEARDYNALTSLKAFAAM